MGENIEENIEEDIEEDSIVHKFSQNKNLTFEGWEKVHKAAYYNDYDTLLEELNNGICINSVANNFISLYEPIIWKNRKIYFNNMTPLYIAAQKGHTKCVKLLVERGANPTILAKNTHTNSECSALTISLYWGHLYSYWIMKNSIKNKNLNKTGLLANIPLSSDYT